MALCPYPKPAISLGSPPGGHPQHTQGGVVLRPTPDAEAKPIVVPLNVNVQNVLIVTRGGGGEGGEGERYVSK